MPFLGNKEVVSVSAGIYASSDGEALFTSSAPFSFSAADVVYTSFVVKLFVKTQSPQLRRSS